mgnify:FL=1|tara:strand:- start:203 stop:484 length:282 start_codon:yes stop_codon:yes gene_type:complete
MYGIVSTLIIICSILLVLIILIQNPKGGGLSSSFGGGANQMMGVKKTGDFLEKSTWILAISLITLILISSFFVSAPQEKTINHDNTNKIDFTP